MENDCFLRTLKFEMYSTLVIVSFFLDLKIHGLYEAIDSRSDIDFLASDGLLGLEVGTSNHSILNYSLSTY
jgi:hypothetical protein